MARRNYGALNPRLVATIVLALLASGCSLSPSLSPTTTKPSTSVPSSHTHVTAASFTAPSLPYESGQLDSPPAYLHCSPGGHSIELKETLGIDHIVLTIRGLRAAEKVSFGFSHPSTGGTSAQLSDTGRQLPTALQARLNGSAGGNVSVAKDGESGQVALVLTDSATSSQWTISGHWSCRGRATVGSATPEVPAVLVGASVPPVVALCAMPLTPSATGTIGPVKCSGGALNALAWDAALNVNQSILGLGAHASNTAITNELCQPAMQTTSLAEAESVVQIAQTYYGWVVPDNLASVLATPGCL